VTIPTLIGISIIVFLMVRLLPSDVIDVLLGGDQSRRRS
jgi:ABC-type dipeptide/oligopeptide/nickel transport system permease component